MFAVFERVEGLGRIDVCLFDLIRVFIWNVFLAIENNVQLGDNLFLFCTFIMNCFRFRNTKSINYFSNFIEHVWILLSLRTLLSHVYYNKWVNSVWRYQPYVYRTRGTVYTIVHGIETTARTLKFWQSWLHLYISNRVCSVHRKLISSHNEQLFNSTINVWWCQKVI